MTDKSEMTVRQIAKEFGRDRSTIRQYLLRNPGIGRKVATPAGEYWLVSRDVAQNVWGRPWRVGRPKKERGILERDEKVD